MFAHEYHESSADQFLTDGLFGKDLTQGKANLCCNGEV